MSNQKNLSFERDGSPYCEKFNDIYFDASAGYAQSQEIFIHANQLEKHCYGLLPSASLTIAETGFGTGLNFLLTLKCYQKVLQTTSTPLGHIHFISTEKYPLTKTQIKQALADFPDLTTQVTLLCEQYPTSFKNKAQLSFFDGKVTLEIFFNDAATAFSTIELKKKRFHQGLVDIWFLDGFAPSKNPEMWSDSLFEQITRLSKEQSKLSTFTTAGFVKRKLKQAGFRVQKVNYLGNKNEFTCAVFQNSPISGKGYQIRKTITKPQQVTIIGGGIASATAAYLLTKNGIKVKLYCKDNKVAQGASSNEIGALYPLLHQQQDEISLFYQQAFLSAKKMYQGLLDDGFEFAHDWCGLLEISYKHSLSTRQQKFEQLNAWPASLIQSLNQKQASKHAGISLPYGGLFMPHAGWIAPQELVNQLLKAASNTHRLNIETSYNVLNISQSTADINGQNTWKIAIEQGKNKKTVSTDVVVLCGGAEAINMPYLNQLPLTSVRGQISSMKSTGPISKLNTVICHKGYLTPANKGIHCIGATFDKDTFDTDTRPEDDHYNLNMLNNCLPELSQWQETDVVRSKARLRCMTPDHLPMVGPMPNIDEHIKQYAHLAKDKNKPFNEVAPVIEHLYIMTGFGARGLCSAPLAAELLLADLCATPYPMTNTQLFNLAPNRFLIRDLIKRKYLQAT